MVLMDKRENVCCLKHVSQFYLHNQINHNHLYKKHILHLHSLVTVFQNHTHYLSKRNYHSRISYERIWGTNVPVMDYDIFKLHHPFSIIVAGPRGAGKSEFVKQLLSLKHFIITNPPERIVWFYGRHQPDLFCSLTQEIPCIEFYEELPTNIEVMFDRSKRNICIIDDLMQSASGNQLVENLFTNGRHLNLSVVFVSQNLFYMGKKFRTISLNSTYIVVFKNPRD